MKKAEPMYCPKCKNPCKPDIVFFGESLPKRFFDLIDEVKRDCDLLIIMGSSLVVMPFCMLPLMVEEGVPRLIINNELPDMFKDSKKPTDVHMPGDCDDSVAKLLGMLKWDKDFQPLVKEREAFATKHGIPLKK